MSHNVVQASGAGPVEPTEHASTVLRPGRGGRITGGLWQARRAVNGAVSVPDGWERLLDAGNLHNLELAAGRAEGTYSNDLPFMDSDLGKWLEAVGWLLAGQDGNGADADTRERLNAFADTSIDVLRAAQEDDGYLNSYVQVVRGGERWTHLDWGHEHYSAGHLVQAGVALFRATGRRDLLDVCCRLADCIDASFGTGPGQVDGVDGHPEIEMALVELYRVTGERRYLDRAAYFVDRRGYGVLGRATHPGGAFGGQYWQDHVPVREATAVDGHSVRQLYLIAGVVDVYAETGDATLLEAAERLWEEMVATKTYITGGVGSHHQDEAFGDPYELPSERAYTETCAAIASVMVAWRLLLATGKARYADLAERTLYNAVLPGVSLAGDTYLYVNPLQVRDGHVAHDGPDSGSVRTPWFRCACCPPNLMRTLASLEHYVLAASDTGPVLAQYVPGEFEAGFGSGTAHLAVASGLPWDGDVAVTVVATTVPQGTAWALTLRDPQWSATTTVDAPDGADVVRGGDGWITVTHAWAPGDVVRLGLDVGVRVVAADPRVDTLLTSVAVERGPLVYCAESVDQAPGPDGPVRLDDLVLTLTGSGAVAAQSVRSRWEPELLAGVVTLTAPGRIREHVDAGWWPYRTAGEPSGLGEARDVVLVPYFAWGNRAAGAMRVWHPVR